MDRHKPIRCRMAEKTLSLRMVHCRYDGCGKSVLFANLKDHEANECDYKPIQCKFHLLGCQWKGLRRDLTKHESKCGQSFNANECLDIVQQLHQNLISYKRFCKECHSICSEVVHVSNAAEFEVVAAEELMLCGYDFTLSVRSQKISGTRRTPDVYELQVKVTFDEDESVLTPSETEAINLGVMVAPQGDATCHLVQEIKCSIRRGNLDSGWRPFEKRLNSDEYRDAFRGGFGIKIFDFSDV